jgi:hypothetical protein
MAKEEKTEANKFRVVAGVHIEGNKRYKKGQIVESPNDLIKLFPQKFERVSGTSTAGDWDEGEKAEELRVGGSRRSQLLEEDEEKPAAPHKTQHAASRTMRDK